MKTLALGREKIAPRTQNKHLLVQLNTSCYIILLLTFYFQLQFVLSKSLYRKCTIIYRLSRDKFAYKRNAFQLKMGHADSCWHNWKQEIGKNVDKNKWRSDWQGENKENSRLNLGCLYLDKTNRNRKDGRMTDKHCSRSYTSQYISSLNL